MDVVVDHMLDVEKRLSIATMFAWKAVGVWFSFWPAVEAEVLESSAVIAPPLAGVETSHWPETQLFTSLRPPIEAVNERLLGRALGTNAIRDEA